MLPLSSCHYHNLEEDPGLQKCLLDFMVTVDCEITPMRVFEVCPHELLVQVLRRIGQVGFQQGPCARLWFSRINICIYYDHPNRIDCNGSVIPSNENLLLEVARNGANDSRDKIADLN